MQLQTKWTKLLSIKPYQPLKLLKDLQGIFIKTMLSTEAFSDSKLCTENSKFSEKSHICQKTSNRCHPHNALGLVSLFIACKLGWSLFPRAGIWQTNCHQQCPYLQSLIWPDATSHAFLKYCTQEELSSMKSQLGLIQTDSWSKLFHEFWGFSVQYSIGNPEQYLLGKQPALLKLVLVTGTLCTLADSCILG